jgi:predicted nucleic acid-binding protein
MECVLDSSFALAWGLPDETSLLAEQFLEHLSEEDVLWVPSLWWYEISNALVVAQRKRRLTEADRFGLMDLYGNLPLQTDSHLTSEIVGRLQGLAHERGLSAYDAAYLELAIRKSASLATLDQKLATAARQVGIALRNER